MMTRLIRFSVVLAFVFSLLPAATAQSTGYKVIKKIPVPGEGGWDYLNVDSDAHRLYVSHGTRVEVIDLEAEKVVGQIPGTDGVHGIAISTEFGRGYTSNGHTGNSTAFDLKTLKVLGQSATGSKPDAIIYDPASKRVFAFNGDSSSATAINAADGKVAGTVDLGGGPEFAAADGKGTVSPRLSMPILEK